MRYKIFPVTGRNTEDQVREAKRTLRREQDVVAIGIRWVSVKQWENMKVWFHPESKCNNLLNEEYHERFDRLYGT